MQKARTEVPELHSYIETGTEALRTNTTRKSIVCQNYISNCVISPHWFEVLTTKTVQGICPSELPTWQETTFQAQELSLNPTLNGWHNLVWWIDHYLRSMLFWHARWTMNDSNSQVVRIGNKVNCLMITFSLESGIEYWRPWPGCSSGAEMHAGALPFLSSSLVSLLQAPVALPSAHRCTVDESGGT